MKSQPFNRTHNRKPVRGRKGPKVTAELLSDDGQSAAYRVRYREGRRTVTRLTAASSGHFERTFEAA